MKINSQINPQFSTWPAEKEQLAELLHTSPGKYALEIGSFRGCTTAILGKKCLDLEEIGIEKRLLAIDPWDNAQDFSDDSVYYDFLENIKESASKITVIRAKSSTVLPLLPADLEGNCGFIFVDGDHSYEGTLLDLKMYHPLLMSGGVIAIHDVLDTKGWEGVGRAVDDYFKDGHTVHYLKYVPTGQEKCAYQHGISGLAWVFKS